MYRSQTNALAAPAAGGRGRHHRGQPHAAKVHAEALVVVHPQPLAQHLRHAIQARRPLRAVVRDRIAHAHAKRGHRTGKQHPPHAHASAPLPARSGCRPGSPAGQIRIGLRTSRKKRGQVIHRVGSGLGDDGLDEPRCLGLTHPHVRALKAADGATGSARTSTTVTESPRSINAAASRDPILPAPPVISACMALVSSARGFLRMDPDILPRGLSPRRDDATATPMPLALVADKSQAASAQAHPVGVNRSNVPGVES